MIRRNFHLTQEQNDFLENLEGLSVSEHLRRAIDDYIEKKKKKLVTISPSIKRGD